MEKQETNDERLQRYLGGHWIVASDGTGALYSNNEKDKAKDVAEFLRNCGVECEIDYRRNCVTLTVLSNTPILLTFAAQYKAPDPTIDATTSDHRGNVALPERKRGQSEVDYLYACLAASGTTPEKYQDSLRDPQMTLIQNQIIIPLFLESLGLKTTLRAQWVYNPESGYFHADLPHEEDPADMHKRLTQSQLEFYTTHKETGMEFRIDPYKIVKHPDYLTYREAKDAHLLADTGYDSRSI